MIKNVKSLLSLSDLSAADITAILTKAQKLKKSKTLKEELKNKSLIMIFEKPSLRTRLSFEIGMNKLGGHAVYLAPQDIGLGIRESIPDVARVTSSMGDILMARTYKHTSVAELARFSTIPVINALSDLEHPCQTLADLLTLLELKKTVKGLRIAFIGDGNNNVTHSLCLGSALMGADFICASPYGYFMNNSIVETAKKIAQKTQSVITETEDPLEAASNADVVYTDTWVSMGQESEKKMRVKTFRQFQVNATLMKRAKKDAVFMHDLPAYRGNEVSDEVIDGKQSVVFQQAENRLWAQMALLLHLL